MTFIDDVLRTGRDVRRRWKGHGFAKSRFPLIAARALEENRLFRSYSHRGLLRWLWRAKSLPRQLDMEQSFGQPPVTLFRDPRFIIDLYYWISPETQIHSHGFRGAFTVLAGRTFQCFYDFEAEGVPTSVAVGRLAFRDAALLAPGDVSPIWPGPGFIHQVWHLSVPTVSLVVRTVDEKMPQFRYLKPRLAFRKPGPDSEVRAKRLQCLAMMRKARFPFTSAYERELFRTLEPHEVLPILLEHLKEKGGFRSVRALLGADDRFRRWRGPFYDACKHASETSVDWRRVVDPGERLLLALLLTMETREDILGWVRAFAPRRSPEGMVALWLGRLARRGGLPFSLNETALAMVLELARGGGTEAVVRRLRRKFHIRDVEAARKDVVSMRRRLAGVELLRPLFRAPPD